MTPFQIITIFISVALLLVAVVSAFIAIRNLKLIVKSHADNHEWSRRIATQTAITEIGNIKFDSMYQKFGYANLKTAINLQTVLDSFSSDSELQISCHKILNFYEGLASGVYLGIYDELTIKKNLDSAMEKNFSRFRKYISYRRDQMSNNIWVDQEKLINKWNTELHALSDRSKTGELE